MNKMAQGGASFDQRSRGQIRWILAIKTQVTLIFVRTGWVSPERASQNSQIDLQLVLLRATETIAVTGLHSIPA